MSTKNEFQSLFCWKTLANECLFCSSFMSNSVSILVLLEDPRQPGVRGTVGESGG